MDNYKYIRIDGPKVMHSAAGYYVGYTCQTEDMPGFNQPYSRESEYFATAEQAQKYLDYIDPGE